LRQYDRALQVADSCIALVEEKIPEEYGVKVRAYSYRGDVYTSMKAYERAFDDYTFVYKFVEDLVGPDNAVSYRVDIGKTLQFMGRYREAIPHLEAGIQAMEEINFDRIWELYEQIAICYEQVGNYEKALDYRKRQHNSYSKMMQGKMDNLESEALIKYETGKKDQALAEQALQLKQQARIQLLSWSIAALLAVLFSGLFFFFRRNKKTTAALQAKNQENELLLKEIHHRVKNNLEMVSSLLKLQSVKTKDAEAKGVMEASQNRVQSMGIIHQKLYQGENLASIEMKDYFQNLSENLLDAFGVSEKVNIKYDMEAVELDVDTAIPIGLIVNELLTNALKYAFPGDQKGEIELSLKETEQNKLHLLVADNGIGQSDPTTVKGTGFGSQLVKLLTMQLQGKMKASYENGTRLSFWLEKANIA
jgi:two-component sensor histidine kinase